MLSFLLDLRSQTSSVNFRNVCYINNSELFVNLIENFLGLVLYCFQRFIIFKQLTTCTSGMHKFTKSQEPIKILGAKRVTCSSKVSIHAVEASLYKMSSPRRPGNRDKNTAVVLYSCWSYK